MEILSSNYNCNTLLEFLQEVQEYQDSSIFQTVFIKGIQKLRQAGFYILPTEGKAPKVKFQTIEDKERANKAKIDTEASLVLPDWLAVIDIEDSSFLGLDWEQISTIQTGRGYHIYVFKEDFFKPVKDTFCELRFGKNLLVVLPGSRFWSEKYKKNVFYKVLLPKIYFFNELPEELREWLEKKWNENQNEEKKIEEKFPEEASKEFFVVVDWNRLEKIVLQKYFEGQRQNLVLFLSGWLSSLGVNQKEVEDFVYELCMKTGDKEWRMRIEAIRKTYEKKENIKGFAGLIELGFVAEELDSCIIKNRKTRRQYDLLGKMEFVVSDWHLYQVVRRKKGQEEIEEWEEVGPYIEILEKRIWLDQFKPQTRFLVRYRDQVALWEEIPSLVEIEKFTGLSVLKEKAYKAWLNARKKEVQKTIYISKRTGWIEDIFLHPALPNEKYQVDENHVLCREKRARKKNEKTQHEIIRNLLEEGRMLGFLILCSVSSILLDVFNIKPYLVLVSGPAGVGKTFAVSFTTHLFYDSRDILITANVTQVALELTMKSMKNLPILMDEGALKGRLNLEELVFMIASGKGRARGTIHLNTIISELASVVFLTSEVLDMDEFRRSGAYRRCLYVPITKWEDLTQQYTIRELSKIMSSCCGAGLDYIKTLSQLDEKEKEKIEENSLVFYELYPEQGNIFKAVYLTLFFLQYYYQQSFSNMESFVIDFFQKAKIEYEEEEKDLVKRFIEKFSGFLVKNRSKFDDPAKDLGKNEIRSEIYGRIEGNHVYILTEVFNTFCKEHGFERKILLQVLSEKGILQKSKDGYFRTLKKLKGIVASTYYIILPEPEKESGHATLPEEEKDENEDENPFL